MSNPGGRGFSTLARIHPLVHSLRFMEDILSLSLPLQRIQSLGPWAEVQLSAIVENLKILRQRLPLGTRVAPVLTGNAHGQAGSATIFSGTPVFYDMVRPGMFLYGLPLRDRQLPATPVMSIK